MVSYRLVKSIDQLKKADPPYHGELDFVVVSAKIANPSRLFVTDFTSNPLIENDYARENFIRSFDERIPTDQLIQLSIYENRLMPFMRALKDVRGEELRIGDGWTNLLGEAIFVRASIRFKMFNGSLEGIINSMTLYDQRLANVDLSAPVFRQTVSTLPPSYVFDNMKNFERTIPAATLRSYVTNSTHGSTQEDARSSPNISSITTPDTQRVRNTSHYNHQSPTQHYAHNLYAPDAPTSPVEPNIKVSSSADLPEDAYHDRDYDYRNQSPIHPRPPVPHTQVRSTYEEEQDNFIERWNQIKTTDGKVFEFKGRVVEIEPLFNQLCIKYDVDHAPVLNPITLIVKSGPTSKVRDEDQFMRISFVNPLEIYNFLEMYELELIYIKSQEVYEKFQKILKSRNSLNFKVSRRLIKVNNFGNFIYGWDALGMTLDNLYKQACGESV